MFFKRRKKQQEEKIAAIRSLEETINKMSGNIDGLRKEFLEELRLGYKTEEKWIRRQSESFEDLLEELHEDRERQRAFERFLNESERREQALLAMACCAREQMELLERQILKDSTLDEEKRQAWIKQFEVMNQEAQKLMRPCELKEVGAAGEPLDYDIHEVLDLADPVRENMAGTVAEVFCRGRIYRGSLLKKAQVAAFRPDSHQ